MSYKVNADGIACCLTTPYPKNYEPPTKLSLLEVNRNNFGFIKKLGQGSFGEVWYGTWNNQMPVAIKKLLGNGNMNHARFLNEAELMHRLNHPNVVRILAVCTLPTNEPTYIISELMENGSLKQYMQKLNPVDIRMKNLLEMMKDVSFLSGINVQSQSFSPAKNTLLGNISYNLLKTLRRVICEVTSIPK